MLKICMPGWRRKKSATSSSSSIKPGAESKRSGRSGRSASSFETTDEFSRNTAASASKGEFTNSRDTHPSTTSSSSSTTTSSSLAGLREILPGGPCLYKHRELAKGTEDFSESSKVGGSVFRARLRGADVAVVRRKGSFVANYKELTGIISSVHHINLVKLLGLCKGSSREKDDFIYVCYKFEAGLNLGDALRGSRVEGYTVLPKWTSRLQIALDIALGLEYLHEHTTPAFVHKNIKSSNIIVTNDLRAKIAKLGIPQLTGEIEIQTSSAVREPKDKVSEGEHQTRRLTRSDSIKITGTPGYMAPEYMSDGVVSSRMDVFAYGVVLLEIITGQKPGVSIDPVTRKYKMVSLPEQVKELLSSIEPKKKLRLWMDPQLRDSYPIDTALSVAALAKQCVETDPDLRPPMRNVAAKLSSYMYSSLKWEQSFTVFRENQSQTMEGR